jgi:predicted HicB family RNase H-like nuclease
VTYKVTFYKKTKQNFPLRFITDELEDAVRKAAAERDMSVNAYINDKLKRTLPRKAG